MKSYCIVRLDDSMFTGLIKREFSMHISLAIRDKAFISRVSRENTSTVAKECDVQSLIVLYINCPLTWLFLAMPRVRMAGTLNLALGNFFVRPIYQLLALVIYTSFQNCSGHHNGRIDDRAACD